MVISLHPKDSSVIALIHKEALVGDFLPSLGQEFLTTLYSGVLGRPGIFSFGYKENREIVGFVVGATNITRFYALALRHRFLPLSFHLIKKIASDRSIIKKILETLFYPKKEVGPQAELIVITVSPVHQGKGIGKKLVKALEEAFKSAKINSYKLTVYQHNKNAVAFYENLGFRRSWEFSLYGKMWYVYEKEIKKSRRGPS